MPSRHVHVGHVAGGALGACGIGEAALLVFFLGGHEGRCAGVDLGPLPGALFG